MKTNITTDNYEAYLLDYLEGSLSPEGATELKAFIAAQGLNWDELTESLPQLEAPQIMFENKEDLKKKNAVMPLYVKIASVAAAAGLLFTVTLWPEKSLPKMEPIAELKPIEISHIDTKDSMDFLQRRDSERINPIPYTNLRRNDMLSIDQNNGYIATERELMPLLAELPMKNITALQTDLPLANIDKPDFDFLAWLMNSHFAYTPYALDIYSDEVEVDQELSLIGKAIFKLTDGRHNSFASLINTGLDTAKKGISLAATDMALTAYHRADERFEEAKERWEKKQEK